MSGNVWSDIEHNLKRGFAGFALFAASTAALTTAFVMNVGYKYDAPPQGSEAVQAEFQENLNEIISEKEAIEKVIAYAGLDERQNVIDIERAELDGVAEDVIRADTDTREAAIEALYKDASDRADALEDASEDFARDLLASYQTLSERDIADLRSQFNDADLDAGKFSMSSEGHHLSFNARALSSCGDAAEVDAETKYSTSSHAEAVLQCAYDSGVGETFGKVATVVPAGVISFMLISGIGGLAGRRGNYVYRRRREKASRAKPN